jgi:hypothetical protein
MKNDEKFPTPRQTRIAMLFLVPAALLFGQRALLWADVTLPTPTFKDGDPLTAAQLNGNFNALKKAVDALQNNVVTINNVQFGTSGRFLGPTSQSTDGAWKTGSGEVGYRAGKLLCQKDFGPTAHVCSGVEMTRNLAAGVPILSLGWISNGMLADDVRANGQYLENSECFGFTSNIVHPNNNTNHFLLGSVFGAESGGPGPMANLSYCSTAHPILCCD